MIPEAIRGELVLLVWALLSYFVYLGVFDNPITVLAFKARLHAGRWKEIWRVWITVKYQISWTKPEPRPKGGSPKDKPGTHPKGGSPKDKPGTHPKGGSPKDKPGTHPKGGSPKDKSQSFSVQVSAPGFLP
jgi:hypothetical protein